MQEWVEVHGRSIEDAVTAAIQELGLESADDAEIKVLQEPKRGFLGMGGEDAIVRVQPRPKRRRRRGGRGRGRSDGEKDSRQASSQKKERSPRPSGQKKDQAKSRQQQSQGSRGSGSSRDGGGSSQRRSEPGRDQKPRNKQAPPASRGKDRKPDQKVEKVSKASRAEEEAVMPDPTDQAEVVAEFLEGLLDAYGLEGDVQTRVEDDIIFADISGEQAEALIGPKGSILQAILELARTVVQRKTQSGARLRLDIGGYGERRREALRIYAARLAEQVVEDGTEVMLEAMNPADRKVVHDAIAEVDGVRSYSEGEEPRRSVVVSPVSD